MPTTPPCALWLTPRTPSLSLPSPWTAGVFATVDTETTGSFVKLGM
jgi:hypothetical protein